MSLPWFRFDVNFPQHDKVLRMLDAEPRAGREAAFVYVCGLAYCANNETDGLIPYGALIFIHGRKKDPELLVRFGMWRPHPEGWEVVNYATRQQLAATGRQVRAARTAASRKANCVRWHGPGCGCWQHAPPDLRSVR